MYTDFAEVQRRARLECAPAPGDPLATVKVCVDCGQPFCDWIEKYRVFCADCGAERARRQRADGHKRMAARRRGIIARD